MPKNNSKFYITTPIYYANAEPHIGSAYTTIAADCLARFNRLIGKEVFFLTGTDEHGAKIEAKAKEVDKESQEFVNEIAAKFQFAWDELNISYNNFIRTTNPKHIKAVQAALVKMYEKGDIYKGEYKGLYCRGCEQFKSEKDLVDGLCPDHKVAPELMSEESYIFRASRYAEIILEKIKKDELKIRPRERRNEIISFYEKEGLADVSFSRKKVKWGIALPWDKSHTTYVWADAFLNYLTGLGWQGPGDKMPHFWPPTLQLMSKDILRVHATIWPAMLLSLDLPLPEELFIHGFFLVDGQKMSKSLGNVISPFDLIKRYGVDASRYLLMGAAVFGRDGDISWEKLDEKYNAYLANGLGNLVARSIALTQRMLKQNLNLDKDTELKESFLKAWTSYVDSLENLKIDAAISLINQQIGVLDNYITKHKPWELVKAADQRVGKIMYNILESLRHLSFMVWPFMPETTNKILHILGLDYQKECALNFNELKEWGRLSQDIKINKEGPLFPRIEEK